MLGLGLDLFRAAVAYLPGISRGIPCNARSRRKLRRAMSELDVWVTRSIHSSILVTPLIWELVALVEDLPLSGSLLRQPGPLFGWRGQNLTPTVTDLTVFRDS